MAVATRMADEEEVGAVGAMMSLLMGMRAMEIVSRVARDVDDDGRLLWIPDSKTEAGKRTLEVPAVLRPHLLEMAKGEGGGSAALRAALAGLGAKVGGQDSAERPRCRR
jgi:integrase